MKNFLQQTAFFNAPKSESIVPASSGVSTVQNPYLTIFLTRVQATGYTDHLQLQNYPQVIPHESERKTMEVNGVVYFIPCAECSATYIGETGRTLKVHMAEHRRAVENKDHKNGIAMHVQNTAHTIFGKKQGSL